MQPRLIGKVSQRLRALIKGGDDWGVVREVDIATLGLMERVRDEWQSRQQTRGETRFGLPQLLRSLHRVHDSDARKAVAAFERRPRRLPEHRLGRDGKAQALDAAFFARRRYTIDELTDFADAVFLEIAYRCVLKREPDPAGFTGFVRPLREGVRDRVDVLRALSVSPEGKGQQVEILGLRRLTFWRLAERIRHVGPLVGWLHAVGSAGQIARRLQVLEARSEAGHQEHADLLQTLVASDIAKISESIALIEKSQVQVETAVLGLSNRYRRFLLEAEMRDAARGSGEDEEALRASRRLERLEAAVREDRSRLDALANAMGHRRPNETRL